MNQNKVAFKVLILAWGLFSLSGCREQGEQSIYVLPQGFKGHVIVLYNQAAGAEKKYVQGKRVYEIPADGVLRTKFSPDYRRVKFPEVYLESMNEENRLSVVVDMEQVRASETCATLPSLHKLYPVVNSSEEVEYAVLFVGTKDQIEEYSSEIGNVNILELIKAEE